MSSDFLGYYAFFWYNTLMTLRLYTFTKLGTLLGGYMFLVLTGNIAYADIISFGPKGVLPNPNGIGFGSSDAALGRRIQDGTVSLSDIPAIIVYWIDLVLWLAGSVCVIMVMVGGIQYMIGSVSDDKEQGKKTVIYAITGLIVTFSAWIIVNWIQGFLT